MWNVTKSCPRRNRETRVIATGRATTFKRYPLTGQNHWWFAGVWWFPETFTAGQTLGDRWIVEVVFSCV